MIGRLPFMPPDHSVHGGEIDQLLIWVHVLMLVLFVGWAAFFITALIRFRRSKHPKADYGGYQHRRFPLFQEMGIALFEIVLLIGFAIPIWARVTARPPAEKDATVVRCVAEQYAWNFHYPGPDGLFGRTAIQLVSAGNPVGLDRSDPAAKDDIVLVNQLHLPVGRPAIIRMSSKDVVHSFSIPVMRVKQDVIPGQQSSVWFVPKDAGQWEIACAQLCGLGHYRMRGYLYIQTAEEYQAWVEQEEGRLGVK